VPPFYCCAAREGVHCYTRQAPPIRAWIGLVFQSEDHIPNMAVIFCEDAGNFCDLLVVFA
jgi:hypothetical protein